MANKHTMMHQDHYSVSVINVNRQYFLEYSHQDIAWLKYMGH